MIRLTGDVLLACHSDMWYKIQYALRAPRDRAALARAPPAAGQAEPRAADARLHLPTPAPVRPAELRVRDRPQSPSHQHVSHGVLGRAHAGIPPAGRGRGAGPEGRGRLQPALEGRQRADRLRGRGAAAPGSRAAARAQGAEVTE